jgi:hypothetical protein
MRWFLVLTTVVAVVAAPALAQRGTGASTGVARQGLHEVRGIAGVLEDTEVGTCTNTTGRAVDGAHLILALPDGQSANIHLGPRAAVEDLLAAAAPGAEVTAEVFRTDAMPVGAFAAVTVTIGAETWRLRDDGLRPNWAMGAGRGGGTGAGRGAGGGGGPAAGSGRCWWDVPSGN